MRLIDADKLKEEIGECPENWLDSPEEMQAVDDWNGFMNVIDCAPTIEAVNVIRCSECQYWQPPTYQEQEDGSTVGHCTAALDGQQTDAYWFCADGAR